MRRSGPLDEGTRKVAWVFVGVEHIKCSQAISQEHNCQQDDEGSKAACYSKPSGCTQSPQRCGEARRKVVEDES